MRVKVLSLCSTLVAAGLICRGAAADTSFSHPLPSVNAQPGLMVSVYHRGTNQSQATPPTYQSVLNQMQYARSTSPDYTFIDTAVNSAQAINLGPAGDATPTHQVFGADAAGAATHDTAPLGSSVIDYRGWVNLSAAGTYTWSLNNADDAAAVYVGGNGTPGSGTLLLETNFDGSIGPATGLPNPVHTDIYPVNGVAQTGWYPIEVFYYNQTDGNAGSASLGLSVTGPAPVQFAAYDVFAPNPIHLYAFSDPSSNGNTTVLDSDPAQADGNNGTLVGGATIAGGALQTSGAGQAVSLPPAAFARFFGSFTIEQWFTRADTAANNQTLFSFAADNQHYIIAHPARADSKNLSVDYNNGSGEVSLQAPAPAQGQATLLATTYDATSNTVSLYINGHLITSHALPGGFNLATLATADSGIGGLSPFGDPSFNGSTDEFRMYRESFTQDQLIQDYVEHAAQ